MCRKRAEFVCDAYLPEKEDSEQLMAERHEFSE